MTNSDPTVTLAQFVTNLEYEAIPAQVRDRSGLVVADTISAIIGGNTLPNVARLADLESNSNPGDATILGTCQSAASSHAAMVNATGGTALELDEGHKFAAGHPAIHVLPAVLAEAEITGGANEAFVTAFIAGYEVATRIARACVPLDKSYHMHGLWGTVGTAASLASYRGLDIQTTADAIRMAANHALHTRFETALEGATVRNTYAGASNLAGLLVLNQAEAGFTGLENGIQRHLSRVSQDFDAAPITDRLGDHWEIERGYFKRHAACRYTHAPIDAMITLDERHDFDLTDVDSIRVETYETAAQLTSSRPRNPLQAKFSIPFAVATVLVHGHSGKQAFTAGALNEETFDLADRVSVVATDELTARVPQQRGAKVTVISEDGDELTEYVQQAAGGMDNPFDETDIRAKYNWLVEPTLGSDGAAALWQAARNPANTSPKTICQLAIPES
ncbi:MmgE/PrpD family protein (plasmid) [Natrinema zhouii]|uniref:MmgE/PrpD family protein n=1 Tax=Natrinema zhouii TaxID=1710539 RepID=UPI001CFF5CDF|nr:MmgE/PrpD family protein [Natrinema zhouii]UHQ98847.1 MmgE/PrpD family protein [Natrinema zhouii]